MPGTSPRRSPGAQTALRRANRRLLLEYLQEFGPSSQADIAQGTGLAPATISNLVGDLLRSDDVSVASENRRGKRAKIVSVKQRDGFVVALELVPREDFELAEVRGLVASTHDGLPAVDSIVTRPIQGDSVETATSLVTDLCTSVGISSPAAITVAVRARVDLDYERPLLTNTLWDKGIPTASYFREHFGCPVVVDNESDLATLAEQRWGNAQGAADVVHVRVTHDISGSLMFDGHTYKGAFGGAGRFGHMTADPRGPICHCGSRGCLARVAGGNAMVELLGGVDSRGRPLTLRRMMDLASEGDRRTSTAVADSARAIGAAIGDVVVLLEPHVVLVGGEMVTVGDPFFVPLVEAFHRRYPRLGQRPELPTVLPAQFPVDGPLLGGVLRSRALVTS